MPNNENKNLGYYLKLIGPGLLFAGAAVGVSHLVLATKAGASYGYSFLWIILLANVIKYPFFEFAPRYTAATNKSILYGYKQLGNWVLILFLIVTFFSMFAIQSAVTIVTASLLTKFFHLGANSAVIWSAILLGLCFLILLLGKYKFLDNIMKYVIIALTLASICSVVIALNKVTDVIEWQQVVPVDDAGILLAVMILGWMPGPIDISVWSSLWTEQKNLSEEEVIDVKTAVFDFNVGYVATTILALCFLFLGASIMYKSGIVFSTKGSEFAAQLIDMYTSVLGSWAEPIIGIAAITTMFSTTFTCLDALPRSMSRGTALLLNDSKSYYFLWLIILILGCLVILQYLISEMGMMIKVATILSFLAAPFFAIVNHQLIYNRLLSENSASKTRILDNSIPSGLKPEHLPPRWIKVLSWFGMIFLTIFSIYYVYFLITNK